MRRAALFSGPHGLLLLLIPPPEVRLPCLGPPKASPQQPPHPRVRAGTSRVRRDDSTKQGWGQGTWSPWDRDQLGRGEFISMITVHRGSMLGVYKIALKAWSLLL